MKLPLSFIHDWKSYFTKKRDIKSPIYPYLRKKKKNKHPSKVNQQKDIIIEDHKNGRKYQLEEIKLDDQFFWETTLNEIISKSSSPNNNYHPSPSSPSVKPIKSKLETLAFQRQVMKTYYLKEMENQAYLDTLYIQSHPWLSAHI
ncbi:unnamed protein product [Cunninghamella echinulata]